MNLSERWNLALAPSGVLPGARDYVLCVTLSRGAQGPLTMETVIVLS